MSFFVKQTLKNFFASLFGRKVSMLVAKESTETYLNSKSPNGPRRGLDFIALVKSTVIERRQHQLGRMADFPPPVTFSVFDL